MPEIARKSKGIAVMMNSAERSCASTVAMHGRGDGANYLYQAVPDGLAHCLLAR